MDESRIGLESYLVARLELMAFPKHGNNVLPAEPGDDLGLGAGRLDDLNLQLRAVAGDRKMLGADAVHRRPAIGIQRRGAERQVHAGWPLERGSSVDEDPTLEEVHRRRADKARDEQ